MSFDPQPHCPSCVCEDCRPHPMLCTCDYCTGSEGDPAKGVLVSMMISLAMWSGLFVALHYALIR